MKVDVLEFGESRSNEVVSLCEALGGGVGTEGFKFGHDALSRSGQRRTTSHMGKRHRRRPNERRAKMRRTCAASSGGDAPGDATIPLCREARRRRKLQDIRNSVRVSDTVSYLETHKWYAKRQKMINLWGHHLPQGARGKGLGISSFCKTLSDGVCVHDLSYFWSFRLTGTRDCLLRVLGASCSEGVLPSGADLAKGPKPFEQETTFHGAPEGGKPGGRALSPLLITWFCSTREGEDLYSPLLWVHCHTYDQVKSELEKAVRACTGPECKGTVSMECLESRIKRVEVRGSQSRKVVEESLGVPREKMNSLLEADPCLPKRSGWGKSESLNLLDPRLRAVLTKGDKFSHPEHLKSRMESLANTLRVDEGKVQLERFERKPMDEEAVGRLHRKANLMHDVHVALSETAAAAERNVGTSFPVVLIDKSTSKEATGGFSFLLPRRWTHALWMSLVRSNAVGVGLREWKWYTQICERCVFPDSYPDLGLDKSHSVDYATNARLRDADQSEQVSWEAISREASRGQGVGGEGMFVVRPVGTDPARDELARVHDPRCFVRALLLPARKGTMETGSRIYRATSKDIEAYRDEQSSSRRGSAEYDLGEDRPLLGRVTLGVLPKKCKGFTLAAEAFCHAEGLRESISEQQNLRTSFRKGRKGVLVMLLCKSGKGNPGVIRPAFATLVDTL